VQGKNKRHEVIQQSENKIGKTKIKAELNPKFVYVEYNVFKIPSPCA